MMTGHGLEHRSRSLRPQPGRALDVGQQQGDRPRRQARRSGLGGPRLRFIGVRVGADAAFSTLRAGHLPPPERLVVALSLSPLSLHKARGMTRALSSGGPRLSTMLRDIRPRCPATSRVRWEGLEPSRPCGHMALNHACLPISAPPQRGSHVPLFGAVRRAPTARGGAGGALLDYSEDRVFRTPARWGPRRSRRARRRSRRRLEAAPPKTS